MAEPQPPEHAPVPPAGAGPIDEDWPAQATDSVVRVVDAVRDRTTGPALSVAQAVVFGVVAAIAGAAALVWLVIGTVRVGVVLSGGRVWAVYTVLGLLLCGIGVLLWARRLPAEER